MYRRYNSFYAKPTEVADQINLRISSQICTRLHSIVPVEFVSDPGGHVTTDGDRLVNQRAVIMLVTMIYESKV